MSTIIRFREVKKYKFQLMESCSFNIDLHPEKDIFIPSKPGRAFIYLSSGGRLTVFSGYAWNVPGGALVGAASFMRASLVHNALYQLMRRRAISDEYRLYADRLLRKMCREDGLGRIGAWLVYCAVRWFGEPAALPYERKAGGIIMEPMEIETAVYDLQQ